MIIEYVVGPIAVKCVELIIGKLTNNKDVTDERKLTELTREVKFLKRNLGKQIKEDEFWRVHKELKEIYPLLEEYVIIPFVECEIYYDKCIGCGLCEEVCPTKAIILNDYDEIESLDLDRCIGCGLCQELCQVEAIEIFLSESEEERYMGYFCPNCGIQITSIIDNCGAEIDRFKCGNCGNWSSISDICPYCGSDIITLMCYQCGDTIQAFNCPQCGKLISI